MRHGLREATTRCGAAFATVFAFALLLLAASVGPGSARAADDELVRFLVKEGCAALDKGKTDDAIAKFRKATVEDAAAVDAWAWLGQALEKKGDKPAAIAAYRSAAAAMAARRRAGTAKPELQEAAKRAATRLESLAPGEAELRRLTESHLADLLALARASAADDAATAKRAIEAALSIAPEDPAVRALSEQLGVVASAGGKAEGSKPDASAPKWDDWIARKAIDSTNATYEGSTLTYEVRDKGEIAWADPQPEIGERFVLEMEFRVVDRAGVSWHAGWAFYEKPDRFVSAFLKDGEVVLFEGAGDEKKDLAVVEVPEPKDKAAWRRLAVTVEKRRHVTVAVDGKTLVTHDLPADFEAEGRVGVWTQRAKVEYRRLRVGAP